MKLSTALLCLSAAACGHAAFVPNLPKQHRSTVAVQGYLDDLSAELYSPDSNPDIEGETHESTRAKDNEKDRYGVSSWDKYVEFEEFDGGDGQMGVAGDGNKGLEKFGHDVQPQLAKSKAMSAKNAWGTSTGYADDLIEKGVELQRAQQIENWRNQQEIRAKKNAQREAVEMYDKVNPEEDWRALAKFGVERNEDFDMNEVFGEVVPGDQLEGTIELKSRIGIATIHEMGVKNEYMGFADFRAAFTADTPMDWTITPNEGSLTNREPTNFIIKFKPQNPGVVEGYLVIETEDFKKTWKVVGGTA